MATYTAQDTAKYTKVDFTWSPQGSQFTTTVSGNTYPPAGTRFAAAYTPINQLITFVSAASSVIPIIQYVWDFGDGSTGFGQTVSHTFKIANLNQQTSLRVIDALGRQFTTSKILLLQVQTDVRVSAHLRG